MGVSDAAVEEAASALWRAEPTEQVVTEDCERQRGLEAALARLAVEGAQRRGQRLQPLLVVGAGGLEQLVDERVHGPHPGRGRPGGGQGRAPVRQALDERRQAAQGGGGLPLEQRRRDDAMDRCFLLCHRHAQEEAPQRHLPRVRGPGHLRRSAEDLRPHGRIQAPVRVHRPQRAPQRRERRVVEVDAPRDRRHLEQAEHFTHGEAALG
jgi:hypothetical protein